MFYSREFDGKVALVTGGSSGIGKATALAFAHAGANVVIAGRRVAEGEQTVHEICERGGDAIFVKTDVSKESDVEGLINKTIEFYGRLDYACNNAGTFIMGRLFELSEEDWDRTINANLKGIWLSLKYQIPIMLQQRGGVIVNMASMSAIIGNPGVSIYSASKGGVIALTQSAAIEYATFGIRINAISPGVINTPMVNDIPTPLLTDIQSKHPIGRLGKPEEIADAVVWLCSDKASFVTGHNLVIDGGYTAQ
ncbi:short chain dehydrogenase [Oscillatoriales cyanobacterium USR001]|nr:short chain dehydrogenase [Oscillatoriales cyanobacterium USR001]